MTTAPGHVHASLAPAHPRRLGHRAQLLAGTSVAYNVIEAIIAITAGLVAGSVALVGFGLTRLWKSPPASSSCGTSSTGCPRPANVRHCD